MTLLFLVVGVAVEGAEGAMTSSMCLEAIAGNKELSSKAHRFFHRDAGLRALVLSCFGNNGPYANSGLLIT